MRSGQKGVVGDLSRICTVGLTGPDPDGAVSEDRRVATDCRAARNSAVTVRTLHALAGGTEAQPVITALHDVVAQLAVVQWQESMRTPISQRDDLTSRGAI